MKTFLEVKKFVHKNIHKYISNILRTSDLFFLRRLSNCMEVSTQKTPQKAQPEDYRNNHKRAHNFHCDWLDGSSCLMCRVF